MFGNVGNLLSWTTPSGFDVKYENYMRFDTFVRGFIYGYGNGHINHAIKYNGKNPNTREFISGVSPNIVHSMDAAQLAITCVEHDGTFAGIHDSYSTHASSVEGLLHTAKRVFIDMYKDGDFLDRITNQILSDDKGFTAEKPENGTLNLEDIYESDGFFS